MNVKLEAALAYSRMRWRIFPCHSIVGGKCSCGKPNCPSPGKHPRTKGGFKDATGDEAQIRKWWIRWPDANIALATGGGLVVFDIDGPDGFAEFQQLVATHGPVPATLTQQTGRGAHLVFATRPGAPQVRSSAMGKVHVRSEGGYIILAPSDHISGRKYQWIKKVPVAPLPDWLRRWSQGYEVRRQADTEVSFGELPSYLNCRLQASDNVTQSIVSEWSADEQARLESALKAIPADQHDTWVQIGMALRDLDWIRSDGTEIAFELWVAWSETCPAKFSLEACESRWRSFGRRAGVTVGTIYHLAKAHGWNGGLPPPGEPHSGFFDNPAPRQGLNGHATTLAPLPPQAIVWPDTNDGGFPRATMTNAKVAISHLGLDCRYDLFHNRMLVAGELISKWASTELSDNVVTIIRDVIRYRYGFDPNKQNTVDACEALCLQRRFDPVLDYLDSLQWDDLPRLDRWLATYLGAADTELNRAIGRLALTAAVRRARRPGTKFDQIIVLEGIEGKGKSSAIELLAGSDNFSDQTILGLRDREQQEAVSGIWLYEISDLGGMRKAEVEHVKAFASRKVDRARPAYGRYRMDVPRRAVFFATTNDDGYLRSETGNRRFWPVETRHVDLEQLAQDRDQLWAEASHIEAQGLSLVLPERLWSHATATQVARLEADPWSDLIARFVNLPDKERHDVSIVDVLVDNQFLRISPERLGQREQNRAAAILKRLGFTKYRKRDGRDLSWRYRRDT